eukprot:6238917-Pyramimonas_sp.AAC.1
MPGGAPGLDGHRTEWLDHLHYHSLERLAMLLNEADRGRLPSFWRHARVTLIPKGPDSPPGDRRPLTVMAITYRLWAKRHPASLNTWLMSWKPPGLAGAMPNHSCPEILWH